MTSRNQVSPRGFALTVAHALIVLMASTAWAGTSPQAPLVSTGIGYVDVVGSVLGTPAPADQVVQPTPTATATPTPTATPTATIAVTNTNDSAAGSLRHAITAANPNPDADITAL